MKHPHQFGCTPIITKNDVAAHIIDVLRPIVIRQIEADRSIVVSEYPLEMSAC